MRPPFLVSKSIECSRERVFEKFFAEAEQKVKLHFCIAELLLFRQILFLIREYHQIFAFSSIKNAKKFFRWS